MGRFVKGDLVVVPFPFSDLSTTKKRPALVVAELQGDDVILCQVTSQSRADKYSIPFATGDLSTGKLRRASYARPNRLFTGDSDIILYQIGSLRGTKMQEVIDMLVQIVTA